MFNFCNKKGCWGRYKLHRFVEEDDRIGITKERHVKICNKCGDKVSVPIRIPAPINTPILPWSTQ